MMFSDRQKAALAGPLNGPHVKHRKQGSRSGSTGAVTGNQASLSPRSAPFLVNGARWREQKLADSDEAARANRHDAARDSEMMSPGIPG